MNAKQVGTFVGALAAVALAAPSYAAVFEDFQGDPTPTRSGSELNDSPLFFFHADRELDANVGRAGNFAWDTGNGAAFGAGTLDTAPDPDVYGAVATLPTSAEFSMLVGIGLTGSNPVTSNNGGAAGFGWTRATGNINNYSGGGTGVTAADHFTIGLYKISGDPRPGDNFAPAVFGLSWANGVSQQMVGGNAFHEQVGGVALDPGNFYRLHGTIEFDAGTETFTFSLSVDNWGDGSGLVQAGLLTGSSTATITGFGAEGQPLWWANASRGGGHLDDISFVPEPASLALLGLGGLAMLGRRKHI